MRAGVALLLAVLVTRSIPNSAAERVRRLDVSVVLPNYGDDWYTVPQSINNRGEIAGYAERENEGVAWVRTSRGRYEAIADRAFALDINNRGEAVGVRFPCETDECAGEGFFWSRDRGLQELGAFVPFSVSDNGDMAGACGSEWQACVMRGGAVSIVAGSDSVAYGINGKGHVVGRYGDNRAFHLTPDWQFNDIGRALATDINDRRTIAGHRWMPMGERGERAVVTVWSKGVARSPAREVSTAAGINNKGWVIANAWDAQERAYSFVWDSKTNARVILESSTDDWVLLESINDRGDVVGLSGERAVIWNVRQRHMTASAR